MKGKSRYAGIVLTAAVHAALLILLLSADIRSTPTVPPVDGMLIEFTEEDIPEAVEEKPVPVRTAGRAEGRRAGSYGGDKAGAESRGPDRRRG